MKEVHFGKVILDHTQLDVGLRDVTRYTRDAEDPNYASRAPNGDNWTQLTVTWLTAMNLMHGQNIDGDTRVEKLLGHARATLGRTGTVIPIC